MRIHIIGLPSAGKSSLARELGAFLGTQVYSLDGIAYSDEQWTPRPAEERAEMVDLILKQDAWISEGGHIEDWIDPLLQAADVIVWLDPPLPTLLRRHLRRHGHRGVSWLLARWRFQVRCYFNIGVDKGFAEQPTRSRTNGVLRAYSTKAVRFSRYPDVAQVLAHQGGN